MREMSAYLLYICLFYFVKNNVTFDYSKFIWNISNLFFSLRLLPSHNYGVLEYDDVSTS